MDHYKNIMNSVTYQFPDPDLIPVLVEMYFHEVNFLLPLLHRPSFSKDVARKLYLRDKGFAGVFLLVCAIGARYVDDQRVRLNGETAGASSGWKWFNQVQMVRNKSLWAPPCLTDLQIYAVRCHISALMMIIDPDFAHLARCHVPLRLFRTPGVLVHCWCRRPIRPGRWRAPEEGLQLDAHAP